MRAFPSLIADGHQVQRSFHNTSPPKQPPHVYAVGENAYRALLTGAKTNQTIVITGESGSGKTISCNHIIDYLAARGQAEEGLSEKLINAGAVLEAFGNAPTARNHNSSRYAKVVNIHFGPNGGAVGASVSTFLLERGRVTDENPFHIITALRQYDATGTSERFNSVCRALVDVGIDTQAQGRIWEMLRGIDSLMKGDDVEAGKSFGVDAFNLREAIRNRTVKVGSDVFNKQREGAELQAARHGLVRSLYVWLFEWIVERINVALGAPSTDYPCISLVDIFGFESFDGRNSLAQFLINWANEQLLCHLSQDMLEHEADQYAAEGIKVDRPPQLPSCLPLLVGTPGKLGQPPQPGISSLLDDETRRLGLGMKNVTDEGFARNVAIECSHHHGYLRALAAHEFKVAHYAAAVSYDSRGFLAANSERVDVKLLEALDKGEAFVRTLVESKLPSNNTRQNPFTSVVTSFRQSIQRLDALLASTHVHYVHCIKPNEKAMPRLFEHERVQMQMEATGVAHISRFARAHGPLKIPREEMSFYALLLGSGFDNAELPTVVARLNELAADADGRGVQLGTKHVFFRSQAMQRIQDALEPQLAAIKAFQTIARMSLARRSFLATRRAAVRIQSLARGHFARKEFKVKLEEARAAAAAKAAAEKAAAEKAAAEKAAAEKAAAEKAAAEKAAAERAAAERAAAERAAKEAQHTRQVSSASQTSSNGVAVVLPGVAVAAQSNGSPAVESRQRDIEGGRPSTRTPDTVGSCSTAPTTVPVTPPKQRYTRDLSHARLSSSESFFLENFEHPSVDVDSVVIDNARTADISRDSFDSSGQYSVTNSVLGDYDETTSSSIPTSNLHSDPPASALRDIKGNPLTDSSSIAQLVYHLLHAANDFDSAKRVGLVLGSVIRWYDAAKRRYIPEIMSAQFLTAAQSSVRRQSEIPQLWCTAAMAHTFRLQLSPNHQMVKQLDRLQESALDFILQKVYGIAENVIKAAIAPDSARKMSPGRPLLDTLWGEMSEFSDVVRDVTGRTILDRMFQILITRMLTKKIKKPEAAHILGSLAWICEWRDEVGLAESPIESVALLMLSFMAGIEIHGDEEQLEDLEESMNRLLSARFSENAPTKAANAALRQIADAPPSNLAVELGRALSYVDVHESAGEAADRLGEHVISKKHVYSFLAWVGRVGSTR
ncbi:P-loop containing nucleoside triphosphate hydrolase protein [Cutaneotrichosporon oleaginosum]|uniref:p-loop containing nucleoside triphosphate hydrolase protein n=1 Tax=Cutaneotrichosporon oleaginosum TaxID=879819 RepID=A0A0J0XCC3_9TREE|nr:P-loop containing nucleoside triphosphate hydrolase protein [Cutaneotrichosporon oleaginosum]KLT38716.1 P-loop containing nucleoside triphosphate hydrolase protein [Cutaneotrichosporon oleaginosum]TXT15453.1 hypothetical protein COLE_01646 [Cutaneotrichosporon oleaginosum]